MAVGYDTKLDKNALLKLVPQDEEKRILARLLDQIRICQKNDMSVFSEFLDPHKLGIFLEILKKNYPSIQILCFGGTTSYCERNMMGFAPAEHNFTFSDFPIAVLEITYTETKFNKSPNHRDFLGSILGLGIQREKIGDILLEGNRAIVFVRQDVTAYISTNLEKVGRVSVRVAEYQTLDKTPIPETVRKENSISVSSLRLDAVAGAAFHLSRTQISKLIKSEKVFVNWVGITKLAHPVSVGDYITLRGYGRIEIAEITGKSKKNRIFLRILLT